MSEMESKVEGLANVIGASVVAKWRGDGSFDSRAVARDVIDHLIKVAETDREIAARLENTREWVTAYFMPSHAVRWLRSLKPTP